MNLASHNLDTMAGYLMEVYPVSKESARLMIDRIVAYPDAFTDMETFLAAFRNIVMESTERKEPWAIEWAEVTSAQWAAVIVKAKLRGQDPATALSIECKMPIEGAQEVIAAIQSIVND